MKTETEMREYLRRAGGDVKAAFVLACQEHNVMDQTIDMKLTQLEMMAKSDHDSPV